MPSSYAMIRLDELTLVGIAARTSNGLEMSGNGKIGGLWDRFWKEGADRTIPSDGSGQQPIYGCYCEYEDGASGSYTILIGNKVTEIDDRLHSGLESKVIPASDYAVFKTRRGPIATVVLETWQEIWRLSADSKIQRTFTGDFEFYDERSADPDNTQVEIYVAVKSNNL
ncbi:AraC family transcriptional regulator [Cohnella terricola]|uniref:AraC family transcriptional regulator n=2 Tax=Cohnella terricola TaxID=1289167 RepID=A0A559JXP3_9BACL|nr:AraC family transcriptional regulator [Cohnella terricola]